MATKKRTQAEWNRLAARRLKKILLLASEIPSIRKLRLSTGAIARPSSGIWKADVTLIGEPAMTQLNGQYRGKKRPTDVLSFNSPEIFQNQGELGELVICLPVLKRQAQQLGHRPETELLVLLVHGLLHLLGLDHEKGPKEARKMAALEQKLLEKALGKQAGALKTGKFKGLIARA